MMTAASTGPHQCPTCAKTFARLAHLHRHEETHRGLQHWECQFCASSYTRRDALNRHLGRCPSASAGARVGSSRVNRACKSCSDHKVRCSREQPCRRCVERKIECLYLLHGASHKLPDSFAQHPPNISPPETEDSVSSVLGSMPTSESHGTQNEQSPTIVAEDIYPVDLLDTVPWLSWNWREPSWNARDSASSFLNNTSDAYNESAPVFPADQWLVHAERTPPDAFDNTDLTLDERRQSISSIVDAKIDPVEHHRQSIIAYLRSQAGDVRPAHLKWLGRAYFPALLKTYFTRHHRQTPIIHLPTFNIVACPTSLVFALALVAASYDPKLGLRAADAIALVGFAYRFALDTDERVRNNGKASLETLQALLLLGILDRLMIKRPLGSSYVVNLGKVARLARKADVFDDPGNWEGASWQVWATCEARRRLGLVLFAFDALISVLHDEVPSVLADELDVKFPGPESLFLAATEAEWQEKYSCLAQTTPPCSISVTLSALLRNPSNPIQLPNTLMGRFALLHGVLEHVWRTKRAFLADSSLLASPAVESYLLREAETMQRALRTWREGWPEKLLDFDPSPISPSLYQDRGAACWCLIGILTLPHVLIRSPKHRAAEHGLQLTVHQIGERLMILSDRNTLNRWQQDFVATYRLVMEVQENDIDNNTAISGLIYRDLDTTRVGFEV